MNTYGNIMYECPYCKFFSLYAHARDQHIAAWHHFNFYTMPIIIEEEPS